MPIKKITLQFSKVSPESDFEKLHDLITDMWARTPENVAVFSDSLDNPTATQKLQFYFRDPQDLEDTRTLIDSVFDQFQDGDRPYGFNYVGHEIQDCSPADIAGISDRFEE